MSARPVARLAALAVAGTLLSTPAASAQTIAERVSRAPDGTVRLSYEARDGVCGTESGGVQIRDGERRTMRGAWRGGDESCDEGPVHIALRVRGGRTSVLEMRVGRTAPVTQGPVTELGSVEPAAAARFLLGLARSGEREVAKDAVFPATLARGVVLWPDLLELARDERIPREARKQAVFWLGQEAATAATAGLAELVGDDARESEIRKQAVFALSQRPNGDGIPHLIRAARTSRDPEVRKAALFWLAESKDARAVELFEEILRRG